MPSFAHTPYDGSHKPFSIGLAPLDLKDWIEPDDRLARDLAEKEALIAERRAAVFGAEPGTEAAQAEVLALLAGYLPERFPDLWRRRGETIEVVAAGRALGLSPADPAPLLTAARLVQEDLVLMRRGESGWRLVAAALCFPSSWSLAEKFGRDLDAIHATVPGYADRLGTRMARIFDNLRVELPVWRVNWSIYPDAELHHPEPKERPRAWFGAVEDMLPSTFVRVERQTLRRLPGSGDILFTIRVHVDPIAQFRAHPEGARLAAGLREQLLGLDAAELRYKGLEAHRDRLAEAMAGLAGLQEGEPAAE
jgi:hypothetical protein